MENATAVSQVTTAPVASESPDVFAVVRSGSDLFAQANALMPAGRFAEAVVYYGWAAEQEPERADIRTNQGVALHSLGRLDEAEATYRAALAIQPQCALTWFNLGNVLRAQERCAEAIQAYFQALAHRPDYAEAYNNLGALLTDGDRWDEALECFRRAVRLHPTFADAHLNLANLLRESGRPEEALPHYRETEKLRPASAPASHHHGLTLYALGRLAEAAEAYRRAVQSDPNDAGSHYNLALVELLRGNYTDGWREYEWRRQCLGLEDEKDGIPFWDGRPLPGQALLLKTEQGFGDAIQFVRYAAKAKERVGRILLACPPELKALFANVRGLDAVVVPGEEAVLTNISAQARLLSLPHLLQTGPDMLAESVPYLSVLDEQRAFWKEQIATLPGRKIGIAWRGRPTHLNDRHRSCGLERFLPLAETDGVTLVSLQKKTTPEEKTLGAGKVIFLDGLDDFTDTAAVLSHLDLTLTVDTSVAHLAGALGVPVWTLLPHLPDWRWRLDRPDTPWYPTMRLFRQPKKGDWNAVFTTLNQKLDRIDRISRIEQDF